jgi:hypothetical protein
MPSKRKGSLSRGDMRKSAKNRREQQSEVRSQETDEERNIRHQQDRAHQAAARSQETDEERNIRLQQLQAHSAAARSQETDEERNIRLQQLQAHSAAARSQETDEERNIRLQQLQAHSAAARSQETDEDRNIRRQQERDRIARRRRPMWKINVGRKSTVDELDENQIYEIHDGGSIREAVCTFCKAYRFKSELDSFCCMRGKVVLEPVPPPPQQIVALYNSETQRGRHFLDNSRAFNNILSLASIGCQEHLPPGNSSFNPTFTIKGKLYHRIGSMLPAEEETPKFMQLFFYDTDNELQNRMKVMDNLQEESVLQLQETLHACNNYVKSLKCGLEQITGEDRRLILHADKASKPKEAHCRSYNLPTASEVAVILPGEFGGNLDIIIQERGGQVKRINSLNRAYDPLHYVLMFPYGTDGYQLGLNKSDNRNSSISPSEFYRFRLQVRQDDFNIVMKLRRLTQQYAVDMWTKAELARLNWVKFNQTTIRAEKYNGLLDAAGDNDLADAGTRIILPPTITGTPRFYNECFQSAMSIVRVFGKPSFFVTFTTNPKWPEIQDALHPGEVPSDRPDITGKLIY